MVSRKTEGVVVSVLYRFLYLISFYFFCYKLTTPSAKGVHPSKGGELRDAELPGVLFGFCINIMLTFIKHFC